MANGLANALAGMSPEQAQQAMGMAISALGQQRGQDVRMRGQDIEAQQQARRIDILGDREARLKNAAKVEQDLARDKFNINKKLSAIRRKYKSAQLDESSAQKKLLDQKYQDLKNKEKTIDALNNKMLTIPGTEEKIRAGEAIRAGIFSDVIDQAVSGVSPGDLPANIQEFKFLTKEQGMSDSEAIGLAFNRDKIDKLIDLMTVLPFQRPEEAGQWYEQLEDIGYGKSRSTLGGDRHTGRDININIDTSEPPPGFE